MKISNLLLAAAGIVAVSAQQNYPVNMPQCGSWCGNNITSSFAKYGCSSATDFSCLCKNVTFGYAIHDCSHQLCQNDTAADVPVSWANQVCAGAGVPINLPSANVPIPAENTPSTVTTQVVSTVTSGGSTFTTTFTTTNTFVGAGGSGTGSGSASATPTGSLTAITTSTFTSVVTSGTSTFTTTGQTIIFGSGGGNSSATTSGSVTGTASATGSHTGSVTSAASGSASSGSAGSAASSRAGASSTSSGAAPQQTAPAAALFIAAGFAAALL